jgi:glutathione peroxidase
MKSLILCLISLTFISFSWSSTMYDYSFELPTNEKLELSKYKGKVVMIVNIATRCGFTGQLDDMEKLNIKYKDKDFVLIGVPSNDFGSQTPESDAEVNTFCKTKFNTNFLVTKKVVVKGKPEEMHPFFSYLQNLRKGTTIKWNFEKFIFNKKGEYVDFFTSLRSPNSSKITDLVDKLLKE